MTTHFLEEFVNRNKEPDEQVGLCSIGLTAKKKFAGTEDQTKVTCRSCVQKLMKYTGNTGLYVQAYPAPYIGV